MILINSIDFTYSCCVFQFHRTDKIVLDRNLSVVANLRSDIFALEKELTKQKVKCRALEEELQNPLNIHRWRKLEVMIFLVLNY